MSLPEPRTDEQKIKRVIELGEELEHIKGTGMRAAMERADLVRDLHARFSYRQLADMMDVSETRVWQIAHLHE